jgi:hypothetical protein
MKARRRWTGTPPRERKSPLWLRHEKASLNERRLLPTAACFQARQELPVTITSLLSIGASLAHNRHLKGSGLAEEERFEPTSPV